MSALPLITNSQEGTPLSKSIEVFVQKNCCGHKPGGMRHASGGGVIGIGLGPFGDPFSLIDVWSATAYAVFLYFCGPR